MNHYRMNLTHRFRQGDSTRKEFFRAAQWRSFVQSGIALWLLSFPDELDEPCCDLDCLGGDGTAIGVTQKEGMHLHSIWEPKVNVKPDVEWGRNDRRVLSWQSCGDDVDGLPVFKKEVMGNDMKESVASVLEILKDKDDLPSPEHVETVTTGLRPVIRDEFLRWCGLSRKSSEREALRQLLKIALSNESVTGAIPRPLLEALIPLLNIELHSPQHVKRSQFLQQLEACQQTLVGYGVGPFIMRIIESQRKCALSVSNLHPTTLAFFIQFVGSAQAVFDLIPAPTQPDAGMCPSSKCSKECGHGVELHDPSKTGYDYNCFVKQSGGCERNAWPQPKEGGKCMYFDVSPSDCKKKRTILMGHRARCSLWVWTCMKHHRVVGHHIIKRGEGKRDAILSLYRFKKDPPKMVFVDFACQAEESALNWLSDYYQNVLFYHDIFHGYGHLCSARYSAKTLNSVPVTNTSVMEQVNAFMQSIKGMLSSGRTRVSR